MLNNTVAVFAILLLFLSSYAGLNQALASHTDIFIPVLEMEPESPIAGQFVKLSFVLTNSRSVDMSNVTISLSLDGVWMIDDIHVDVPAKKSIKASFTAPMSASPGQHQLKACPERASLGDDGDHCQTLNFVARDESTLVVAILSPKEEDALRGIATIKVVALGEDVKRVELYVQGALVDSKSQAPFDFTLDTKRYKDGIYRIHATVYYESGITKTSAVKKYFISNSEGVQVRVMPGKVQEAQARVGQQVAIQSDVTNKQSFKIAATLIALVKDANGFTEFLSWKEERIRVDETLPISVPWIPEARGNYTVEVFLWDTIETSVPLADVMKANIIVT